ncbi:hypothetical protein HK105_202132 [Polyrhizophydium stewartii]|uniref:Uncharacterized protein n=1 Tax=Polyrhizophydium stewartii TaxID=2732419 RepID=A0ABR4NFB4_9FUNG
MAGSAISVLTAQAMLTAVGAASGAHGAAGLAIAIDWALKDGFGELGKVLLIKRFAAQFDTHPKFWKIVGEVFSVTGAFLQLLTCIAPAHMFLVLASAGVGFRSLHFSIWAATHTTFTRSMAAFNGSNVGDIVAKADAQLSIAHILGMGVGVGLLAVSFAPAFLFQCFAALAASQVVLTTLLVKSARFEVLDQTRLVLLPREFISTGRVPSLTEIERFETWLGEGSRQGEPLTRVVFGVSAEEAFVESDVMRTISELQDEMFLVGVKQPDAAGEQPTFLIVLNEDVQATDVIKAALLAVRMDHGIARTRRTKTDFRAGDAHAALTSDEIHAALVSAHEWTDARFGEFMDGLSARAWNHGQVIWGDAGIRAQWRSKSK